jgi:hypothetical protein
LESLIERFKKTNFQLESLIGRFKSTFQWKLQHFYSWQPDTRRPIEQMTF